MRVLPPDAPTRADLLLAMVAVSILAGVGIGVVSPLPLRLGGSLGSLVAGVAIADGIRNPPT